MISENSSNNYSGNPTETVEVDLSSLSDDDTIKDYQEAS